MVDWAVFLMEVAKKVGFVDRKVDWEFEVANWSQYFKMVL
jgi:hypothetical protein